MREREQIRSNASDLILGSTVGFDDDAGEFVRFCVYDATGRQRSRAFPHLTQNELAAWDDATLRRVISRLCAIREWIS